MKLKINITKDVLKRSMWCGVAEELKENSENCAIAIAIRDIFPKARVELFSIELDNSDSIDLPGRASVFIADFDELFDAPEARLLLPEFSFEIYVPESVIESINIDDLKNCKTVELCEN